MSKGNPLGDPQQQAQLMNKLNKFARQQDLAGTVDLTTRTSVPSPLLQQHVGLMAGQMGGNLAEIPRFRAAPQDAVLQAALIRSQMDATLLKNLHLANQQCAAAMMPSSQPGEVNAIRSVILCSTYGIWESWFFYKHFLFYRLILVWLDDKTY